MLAEVGISEVLEERFLSALADLTVNSKPLINFLTALAKQNMRCADAIAHMIDDHLKKVSIVVKLPILFLIDSILKNVGGEYIALFSHIIINSFADVYGEADKMIRQEMLKLRQSWVRIVPAEDLRSLDLKVLTLDPNWPYNTLHKQVIASRKVHFNPKFLQLSSSTEFNKLDHVATTEISSLEFSQIHQKVDDDAAEELALRKELLLQKRKREIQREQSKIDLELSKLKAQLSSISKSVNPVSYAVESHVDSAKEATNERPTVLCSCDQDQNESQVHSTTEENSINVCDEKDRSNINIDSTTPSDQDCESLNCSTPDKSLLLSGERVTDLNKSGIHQLDCSSDCKRGDNFSHLSGNEDNVIILETPDCPHQPRNAEHIFGTERLTAKSNFECRDCANKDVDLELCVNFLSTLKKSKRGEKNFHPNSIESSLIHPVRFKKTLLPTPSYSGLERLNNYNQSRCETMRNRELKYFDYERHMKNEVILPLQRNQHMLPLLSPPGHLERFQDSKLKQGDSLRRGYERSQFPTVSLKNPPFVENVSQRSEWHTSLPPPEQSVLDKIAKDTVRIITVDNVSSQIRFYGDIAIAIQNPNISREIFFEPGEVLITLNDVNIHCEFHKPRKEVTIGERIFRVCLGAPTRELYVNDEGFQCKFNSVPQEITLATGETLKVQLHSKAIPLVCLGAQRQDLVAGLSTLIVDGAEFFTIFLDAKPQRFDVDGVPHTLNFLDNLQTVLVNGYPVDIKFGGPPIPIVVKGKEHWIQLMGLPPEIDIKEVNISSMSWFRTKSTVLPSVRYAEHVMQHPPVKLPTSLTAKNVSIRPSPAFQQQAYSKCTDKRLKYRKKWMKKFRNTPRRSVGTLQPNCVEGLCSPSKEFPTSQMFHDNKSSGSDYPCTRETGKVSVGARSSEDTLEAPVIDPTNTVVSIHFDNPEYVDVNQAVSEVDQPLASDSASVEFCSSIKSPKYKPCVDIDSLFERLCKSGLLSIQMPCDPIKDLGIEEKKMGKEVHEVDFRDPVSLKREQPLMIEILHSGSQCSACSIRFPSDHIEKYKKHLDWHFLLNHPTNDLGKHEGRSWYCQRTDWVKPEYEVSNLEDRDGFGKLNLSEPQRACKRKGSVDCEDNLTSVLQPVAAENIYLIHLTDQNPIRQLMPGKVKVVDPDIEFTGAAIEKIDDHKLKDVHKLLCNFVAAPQISGSLILKPTLCARKLTQFPPIVKGCEVSNFCSIV